MRHLTDLNLAGQRLLLRQDLNVPLTAGQITSDARLRAALPSIRQALDGGAKVILLSHLGRPTEGQYAPEFSLRPVADYLAAALKMPVPLVADWQNGTPDAPLILLENVRFNRGESANDTALSQAYARLGDIFAMDAFGSAHRAHASTCGIAQHAPLACAGPLLAAELKALDRALHQPARPMLAIVGGAKVSTKLGVLESLANQVDQLIVGGGIANTLLAAAGHPVGRSLCETAMLEQAHSLLQRCTIPLPTDVVVGTDLNADAPATVKPIAAVAPTDRILDMGPQTRTAFAQIVAGAKTILWNGPLGVFELPQFAAGTESLAQAIAASSGFSIAGGGDTLAAIDQFGIAPQISYISTGGGAFLEYVEGRPLPAVQALAQRASN